MTAPPLAVKTAWYSPLTQGLAMGLPVVLTAQLALPEADQAPLPPFQVPLPSAEVK